MLQEWLQGITNAQKKIPQITNHHWMKMAIKQDNRLQGNTVKMRNINQYIIFILFLISALSYIRLLQLRKYPI